MTKLRAVVTIFILLVTAFTLTAQPPQYKLKKRDRKKDVLLQTSAGNITVRLYNQTPQHRDNFLYLVKTKYYDGVLFHRVINNFMVQAGDPDSKNAPAGKALGNGGPGYTVPAEFVPGIFHKKGVIAAARMGDDVNPKKASSGSQFYLVQGRVFTSQGWDSLMNGRLKGRTFSAEQVKTYTTIGGTPHLDDNYTVFGEIVKGLPVVDSIAVQPTSKAIDRDRPLTDVKIIKARLVKRRK